MTHMNQVRELIEAPLSREELALRYRDLSDDPLFANVPGKIELDTWGRMLLSPTSNYRGMIQARLCNRLADLGGETCIKAPIATAMGLFVADLAWSSTEFFQLHRDEFSLIVAPEICIEVVSPLSSVKEVQEKVMAYLSVGAQEVWIVLMQSKRCAFYGKQGLVERSAFDVDLSRLFD
jgi:Uma2 family endonuclease